MTKQPRVVWSISTSARTMQVAIGRPDSSAQRHRPRASATPGTITDTEHCCVSATTGSVGRRLLRRVTMPTTCTSIPAGSFRETATAGGRAADFTLEPGRAQPSRGESISFLSPARAAGAPTFCNATESKQRSQPRGLPPPWLTPDEIAELADTNPLPENRDLRSRAPPPPPAEGATSLLLRRLRGRLLKRTSPHGH